MLEREDVVAEFKDKLLESGVDTIAKLAARIGSQAEMRDLCEERF